MGYKEMIDASPAHAKSARLLCAAVAVTAVVAMLGCAQPQPRAQPRVPAAAVEGTAAQQPGTAPSAADGSRRAYLAERETIVERESARIGSGDVAGQALAQAHHDRGVAYQELGEAEAALRDFERAMAIAPDEPHYREDRVMMRIGMGQLDSALRDLEYLEQRGPLGFNGLRDLGRVRYLQGRYLESARAFGRALEVASDDTDLAIAAMWLHIALSRTDPAVGAPLNRVAAQLDPAAWPTPLVQMFAGTLSPEQALAKATSSSELTDLRQKCEAYFYIGQLRRMQGDEQGALEDFQRVVATDVHEYTEYAWAKAELTLSQAQH
jgi:lipoprotein NlpI